jgi:hypothetical protein
MLNWNKNVIFDDVIFIASCINEAIGNEIQCWKMDYVWYTYSWIPRLYKRLIDRTFVEIWKPRNNDAHKTWFNGCKKMYYTNNKVMLTIMDCSFTLIVGILTPAMVWLFCTNQTCTKPNVNFLCINTIISSTNLGTIVTWLKKCLWFNNLGSMNFPIDMT